MENNKLLIGVQFTEKDSCGKDKHTNIELYVVRDITLLQLIDGIKYGLVKLAKADTEHKALYKHCFEIFSQCLGETVTDPEGKQCFRNITFTSFNAAVLGKRRGKEDRFLFSLEDTEKPLCDLGFITSSRIIFDATGCFEPRGMFETGHVIEAFNPQTSQKIFFPEYNISTRQLYKFDDTPVNIIAPTDPPQKPTQSLLRMLLPALISVGVMVLIRMFMANSSSGAGMTMVFMSVAMGAVGLITTTMNWKRQLKEYDENLKNWRTHYENYIDATFAAIRQRQAQDAAKLDELYPDMLTLINQDSRGVYALNRDIYSRSPQDADFLSFRIGISDDVPSYFPVNGEAKEVVYSNTFFDIVRDNSGNDRLRVYLRDELTGGTGGKTNLCSLPGVVSKRYRNLQRAPLMYCLQDKSCLGIVDQDVENPVSASNYFISRMIFELCYYHSPDELQFVVFFRNETDWGNVESTINRYKFMPHFRDLFSDKSQFVFDQESAHLVMSSLLTIMSNRKAKEENDTPMPHIVFIVFEEHGLKEHAFAEYLPSAPAEGAELTSPLSLSFVFATKYQEYLPAYCDDVVSFDQNKMTLTPRENVLAQKTFRYEQRSSASDARMFHMDYTRKMVRAMRFLSSVYYARIAQNGKVPSSVSMYDVIGSPATNPESLIRKCWGLGSRRELPPVTQSLQAPVGKTETGIAYLDLHEKADGPHMLVAGTTGSGKTETVISYLLGLCMQYRPDELNLLLVDMKGGGFTKRIGHLPHVVGAVTDVDGDENGTGAEYMLGRFLSAMKSEIKRRKLLFNRLHVDSIDAYIKACGNIEAHIQQKKLQGEEADFVRRTAKEDPLSHLILVVDEFTELKRFSSENGDMDFMGEITTIARVGRSLGFHIILISQNIEGAITDDIRVNSKARLCLKVATRQASKEMLGTELAASPYMPGNGRAYLLVGTGSKFEYFQSAYSGAGVEEHIPVEITLASKTGAYLPFYRSDKDNRAIQEKNAEQKKLGLAKTQLEVLCTAICDVYDGNQDQLTAPHRVFSSPLSGAIAWDSSRSQVMDLSKRKQVSK